MRMTSISLNPVSFTSNGRSALIVDSLPDGWRRDVARHCSSNSHESATDACSCSSPQRSIETSVKRRQQANLSQQNSRSIPSRPHSTILPPERIGDNDERQLQSS